MTAPADDRPYVVISADTHAGASIQTYREYLEPALRDEFDAWRGSYTQSAEGAHRLARSTRTGTTSSAWPTCRRTASSAR